MTPKENHFQDQLFDVAIIGYGPIGQMLSILLGQRGHRVAVCERFPSLYPLPRAVRYDDEVARVFQSAGVAEQLKPVTEISTSYEWRNANRDTLIYFDFSQGGKNGWAASTSFSQPELEGVLDARVKSLSNVNVYQGWEATEATQRADHVAIDVRKGEFSTAGKWIPTDETTTIRARYVIGADGANSTVRLWMDAPVTDLGFAYDWLVVDVIPRQQHDWIPRDWQLCDPARPTTIVSGGPGRRRWEFMRLPDESLQELTAPATAWRLLAPWQITPDNATLERSALYTFRARWADVWRKGRFLLAGDAAHLMPPFAGEGMCTGMRDACNLAWRLDFVLSGKASDALLDSYGEERLAQVQHYINFSVELGKVICITEPHVAAARDAQMLAARNNPPPKPPPPRLGLGVRIADDPASGLLFIQDRVTCDGRSGLFDDVVGRGFVLVSHLGDPSAILSDASRRFFKSIGGLCVHVGADAPVRDDAGKYAAWFADNQCAVVLVRPDFYIFGTAQTLANAEELVAILREKLK
jgi:2-polyprenyl-6-methoxyphenol hydroxylase-like FAD-dependent oxidoreductase